MRFFFFISLTLCMLHARAQFNYAHDFGEPCAVGSSVVSGDSLVYVTGVVCHQARLGYYVYRSYLSAFDMDGNQVYFDYIGNFMRFYQSTKIILDDENNIYTIGIFWYDSALNYVNTGVFVEKRDPDFNIVWSKSYSGFFSCTSLFPMDLVELNNGKIALTGVCGLDSGITGISGVGNSDPVLIVFDSLGDISFTKKYHSQDAQGGAYCISKYGNDRIIIGTKELKYPNFQKEEKALILELDYNGNMLRQFRSSSNRLSPGAIEMVVNDDKSIVYVSNKYRMERHSLLAKPYLEKIDSAFNSVWTFESGMTHNNIRFAEFLEKTENGNYIIGGDDAAFYVQPDTASYYGFIQIFNPNGDSISHRFFNYYGTQNLNKWHRFWDMSYSNGRLFMTGDVINHSAPAPPYQKMWLVSADSNGCIYPLCISVSTEDEITKDQISIFPNPVQDQLFVKGDFAIEEVGVFDLQGIEVFHKNPYENHTGIDLSTLKPSIYIIEIQTGDQIVRKKFIKE